MRLFLGSQALFTQLNGVLSTSVGYMGGAAEQAHYVAVCKGDTLHKEVVKVVYNPCIIDYKALAQFFFEIHNFEQTNGQGPDLGDQYLSVIFYQTPDEQQLSLNIIADLTNRGYTIATTLSPADPFYTAEAYHQNYYQKNHAQPYCHIHKTIFKVTPTVDDLCTPLRHN